MRSMSSGETSDRSTCPDIGLLTRTPSIRTWTWLALAPRMEMFESFPTLPERLISTPGTVRSASSTVS